MEARAVAKYIRVSPLKLRRIGNAIKEKPVEAAIHTLEFMPQDNAKHLLKVLKSALANAEMKSPQLHTEQLRIKELCIDGGPTLKRWRPRARGRAMQILKRTSHIKVVITDEL